MVKNAANNRRHDVNAQYILEQVNNAVIRVFTSPPPPVPWWRVIVWWELRRILYNVFLGIVGILSLIVFFWAIISSKVLSPGEDAVEPIALIIAPLAANFFYTFGWLVELVARVIYPKLTPRFGPVLFTLGTGFSLLIASAPAILWTMFRVAQILAK